MAAGLQTGLVRFKVTVRTLALFVGTLESPRHMTRQELTGTAPPSFECLNRFSIRNMQSAICNLQYSIL